MLFFPIDSLPPNINNDVSSWCYIIDISTGLSVLPFLSRNTTTTKSPCEIITVNDKSYEVFKKRREIVFNNPLSARKAYSILTFDASYWQKGFIDLNSFTSSVKIGENLYNRYNYPIECLSVCCPFDGMTLDECFVVFYASDFEIIGNGAQVVEHNYQSIQEVKDNVFPGITLEQIDDNIIKAQIIYNNYYPSGEMELFLEGVNVSPQYDRIYTVNGEALIPFTSKGDIENIIKKIKVGVKNFSGIAEVIV